MLVADRQYARGAEELRTAVRLNPGDERARLALADALVKSGAKLAPAEQTLKETIAALRASARARYMLGRVYERQSRYPEAVRALEEAVTFHTLPGSTAFTRRLARWKPRSRISTPSSPRMESG